MRPDPALKELQSSVSAFLARTTGRSSHRVGARKDEVRVRLAPHETSLAAALRQEFAGISALVVVVGFKLFPSAELPKSGKVAGLSRAASRSLTGLQVSFEPPEITLPQGEGGTGKVVIRNTGPGDLIGILEGNMGWLRRPSTGLIVGGHSGPVIGTNRKVALAPGESADIGFVTGTASTEPGPDYVVPVGRYEVVVPLTLTLSEGEGKGFDAEVGFAVVR